MLASQGGERSEKGDFEVRRRVRERRAARSEAASTRAGEAPFARWRRERVLSSAVAFQTIGPPGTPRLYQLCAVKENGKFQARKIPVPQ